MQPMQFYCTPILVCQNLLGHFWPKVHVQHVQFTSILQYCKGHFAKPPHSICFIEEWQSGRCNIADQSQGRNIFSRSNTNISSGPNTYPKKTCKHSYQQSISRNLGTRFRQQFAAGILWIYINFGFKGLYTGNDWRDHPKINSAKVSFDKDCSFKARMSSYAVKVTRAKIATLNYTKGHTHSHDVEYWLRAFLDCVSFVTNCCGWF